MEEFVAIAICVILPVAIVLINAITRINADNRRSQVLLKAIEANNEIDADKLAEAMRKPRKTPREQLFSHLLRGCIFSLIGLGLMIVSIVNYCQSTDSSFGSDNILIPMLCGAISLAIGVSYLIVFRFANKQLKDSSEE